MTEIFNVEFLLKFFKIHCYIHLKCFSKLILLAKATWGKGHPKMKYPWGSIISGANKNVTLVSWLPMNDSLEKGFPEN